MTWRAHRWWRVAAVLMFGVVAAAVIVATVTGRHDSPTPPASPMTSQTDGATVSMAVAPPTLVTLVPGPGEVGHGLEVHQLP